MSESLALLTDAASRLFTDLSRRRTEPFDGLWAELERFGFPAMMTAETEGGVDGDWRDAFAVARLAGVHALGLPVVEAITAGAFTTVFQPMAAESLTLIAPRCEGALEGGLFTGTLPSAPWGRHAVALLATCDGRLIRLKSDTAQSVLQRENTAGEPRDSFTFNAVTAEIAFADAFPNSLFEIGALLRTAQIAGAMDAALARSIDYVNERVQFGKPLAKFQAIQQSLAVFAEEAAAVNCAGQAAAAAADRGNADMEIAAAKLRANMASGVGAACAHQAHGAMGFTQECGLHHLTRRLIAWRSEYGSDGWWANWLGAKVVELGVDNLWPELVRRAENN